MILKNTWIIQWTGRLTSSVFFFFYWKYSSPCHTGAENRREKRCIIVLFIEQKVEMHVSVQNFVVVVCIKDYMAWHYCHTAFFWRKKGENGSQSVYNVHRHSVKLYIVVIFYWCFVKRVALVVVVVHSV